MNGEALAAFLALEPPRRVPPEIARAAQRTAAPLFVAVFGGLFLVAGIAATAAFFPWRMWEDDRLRAADTATAVGRVTSVADTRLSISRKRVVRYLFQFQAAGGERVCGLCYSTGRTWSENAEVPVRYRPEDPGLCTIAGARRSAGSGASALVLLFPALGAGLLAWFVLARRRMSALLERGTLAQALVTALEETAVRVNKRRVYAIALQMVDSSAGAALEVDSHVPEVLAFARGRMEGKQPVFVLYDPARPKRALLPETLQL